MSSIEHRIVEVLQSSLDGHANVLNVFNVLNRDGYNVTKHEFEEACKNLHDGSCITYRPIQTSLIDIPIGAMDLLTNSPALPAFSEGARLAPNAETLLVAESSTIPEICFPVGSETAPNRAGLIGEPSAVPRSARTSILAVPILLVQAWQRARANSWVAGFLGFSFRF